MIPKLHLFPSSHEGGGGAPPLLGILEKANRNYWTIDPIQ
jgi:hypothetical protein